MNELYKLEKWIWTEADFEAMGWHDSQIHALAFLPDEFEIVFDIDYILHWVHPKPDETYFKFWVAPATLVFENIYDLELDISSYKGNLEIDKIRREDERVPRNAQYIDKENEWLWCIECQEGEIRFRSVGYKQYIRTNPQFSTQQTLELKSRGFSFVRSKTD
jgi:hypothetical protein